MDRKYILSSFIYAILGMVLGMFMAASQNHSQFVTHAHIMLAGFLMSFVYGLCHKLWLNNCASPLAKAQFFIHQFGAALMSAGLFLLYGNIVAAETIEHFLALSSIAVLLAMMLMVILFVQSTKNT